jgi:hypothetical protein
MRLMQSGHPTRTSAGGKTGRLLLPLALPLPLRLGLLTLLAAASCHEGGLQGRLLDGGTPGNGGAAGNDTGGNGGASAGGMGGASGLAGGGGTAGAPAAALDISGRWALFGFEDPVAVELQQTGTVLAGSGCCTGFQSDVPLDCCGSVTGQCADRRASFGFSFWGGTYEYATDAFVSADGSRMAGTFSRIDTPVAWIRLKPTDSTLLRADPVVEKAMSDRGASYDLVVTDTTPAGDDFSPQQTYHIFIRAEDVGGALGAFWAGEAAWNASEQTLVVGPVPETAPGLPVALRLRFDGNLLTSVDATMVSQATYHFRATQTQF